MRKLLATTVALAVAVVFGAFPAIAGDQNELNNGPLPDNCLKFEGGEIGSEGVSLMVQGVTVTVTGWVEKDGEPDEFVGFDFSADGGLVTMFSVKSGKYYEEPEYDAGSSYQVTAGSWMTGYDKQKGISNVVFCVDGGVTTTGDPTTTTTTEPDF